MSIDTSSLEGKKIVVIGGTAGIGLAVANMATAAGAKVWAAGRSQSHIDKAIIASEGLFQVRQADTHDPESMEKIFKEVGSIDHLVSAAVGGGTNFKTILRTNAGPIPSGLRQVVGLLQSRKNWSKLPY
ncbi:SDR family NAD(P)-dependent oxidoreductase [bacterium]|nr:SDR family NAD(P)-dependent oxidoreductase [bacterium]